MADFRKWFFAMAVTALFVGTASAQPAFTCVSNGGVPPIVRGEGIAELVGDVVLNCTGGIATQVGTAVPANNIQIFLNTNITSRLTVSSSSLLSEAILTIDEPLPANQRVCTPGPCTLAGAATSPTGAGINYNTTNTAVPNVYQGQQAQANSISWNGVPIDPPGSTGTRIIRISNIRANASSLSSGTSLIPAQIFMYITVTGNSQVALANSTVTVGYVQPGMVFNVYSTTTTTVSNNSLQQCVGNNSGTNSTGLATDNTSTTFNSGRTVTLSFKENFASAFKIKATFLGGVLQPQNTLGQLYNTESGFYALSYLGITTSPAQPQTLSNMTATGVADSATRLIARFNNVPAGIVLYVTVNQTTGSAGNPTTGKGPTAVLVNTDINGVGSSAPATATSTADGGIAPITLSNGSGVAVWEVTQVDSSFVDELRFGVSAAYISNPAANLPGLGQSTINGNFAPISGTTTAAVSPVPRFVDTSTARASFSIISCSTNILFPFLTNQAGFDSGVAIANTSADPFGTAAQAGACTLNYYGNTTGGGAAPAAQKSGVVGAGTELLFTLSGGGNLGIAATPGFQGYMIASCAFQYAHGFAFISDVGANKVSEAYLGLIMDKASTVNRSGNTSETFTH